MSVALMRTYIEVENHVELQRGHKWRAYTTAINVKGTIVEIY